MTACLRARRRRASAPSWWWWRGAGWWAAGASGTVTDGHRADREAGGEGAEADADEELVPTVYVTLSRLKSALQNAPRRTAKRRPAASTTRSTAARSTRASSGGHRRRHGEGARETGRGSRENGRYADVTRSRGGDARRHLWRPTTSTQNCLRKLPAQLAPCLDATRRPVVVAGGCGRLQPSGSKMLALGRQRTHRRRSREVRSGIFQRRVAAQPAALAVAAPVLQRDAPDASRVEP